mmetsp:Transcript_2444/g.3690  ORF Transcript_2444/g.3690 Transcript_2444/m.3690 type:complete len:123 (+) Transcript_2444:191-559(+)|eukprot:CAMPEP_0197242996 /NCGR_PEP_ID=MMETSP1429-20130617/8581_1 /TAXON_ID=49237 /ORGANISM="Chaetoceros  sp., Strain UNC1202" /LENGTH=122 /DNA_ID=CAMNT_0042703133 /DNA_START=141 /DNA_END=509 /DNA_ORIENTATION=+
MVHGKAGMKLEAFKFGIYLAIPISASLAFNVPYVQQVCADYFQFLRFPANPNTNLKGEFEELLKKRQQEKEQRKLYAEQLKKLHESAQESRTNAAAQEAEGKKKWLSFSWLRLRRKKDGDAQ